MSCWPRASAKASTGRCWSSARSHPAVRRASKSCAPRSPARRGVVAVTPAKTNPAGNVATITVYPRSSPQAFATAQLVDHLRGDRHPPIEQQTGMKVYVGGVTAGGVDFAAVLAHKLPLFIGVVVLLSALLLLIVFRSLVIPLQAAVMNLLSITAALGRDRRDLPMGLARRPDGSPTGTDRVVHPGDAVCDRVRPLDGLRGLPDLAHARALDADPRSLARRGARASHSPGAS